LIATIGSSARIELALIPKTSPRSSTFCRLGDIDT